MKSLALLVAWWSLATAASADTYMVVRQGAAIAPVRSNDVAMDSETVRVTRGTGEYLVEAVFRLRNTSEREVKSPVAFPVLELPSIVRQQRDRHFRVDIAKSPVEPLEFVAVPFRADLALAIPSDNHVADLIASPPSAPADYPKNIVWDMIWGPNETKVVRVRYSTEIWAWVRGSSFSTRVAQLTYVVSTGRRWKGSIGKADITFDFTFPPDPDDPNPPADAFVDMRSPKDQRFIPSYPDVAKWVSGRRIEWHFENWSPTSEIFLRTAMWQEPPPYDPAGSPRYDYTLPEPYTGATETYTLAFLDARFARETDLSRQYFPDRLTAEAQRRIRIWICAWLQHEIFARHGHDFGPSDFWALAFRTYSYHGGWYQPRRTVTEADLNATERTNLAFLRKNIAVLTASAPSPSASR